MTKHITCGRHDCYYNNCSNCTLNSIAIGKDMKCQFFRVDNEKSSYQEKDREAYMEDVFKPVPMAVFKGAKKIGTIYPAGWRDKDNLYTKETFVIEE